MKRHGASDLGRRVVESMRPEIDKLKRTKTEEALKHARELEGHHPHRRRGDESADAGDHRAGTDNTELHRAHDMDAADDAH